MFKDFVVKSSRGDYNVSYMRWDEALQDHLNDGDVIIMDQVIPELYPDIMVATKRTKVVLIKANEEAKTYESIGRILEQLVSAGFSKTNKIVAIGGGITQDVTSFAASVLLRGVDWTFFPTNLASQCDSCIGSKTSVNLGLYKNQLGGFYPPREIFIDFNFCRTLKPIDICAGLGEMMHYFLVDGPESLEKLSVEVQRAKTDEHALALLISKSLLIKKAMVELDEFDQGPRRVFNYGHTFGHALEAVTNFAIPHGIAVAYGIDLANVLSAKLDLIDSSLRNEVRPVLGKVWVDHPVPNFLIEDYFSALMKDKKNEGGRLHAILTRGLGDMFQTPLDLDETIKNTIADFFNCKVYESSL